MKTLLALLLTLLANDALACSCAGSATFLQSAKGRLVIRGVVEKYVYATGLPHPVAMDVSIREVLAGRHVPKTIRIVGDFGMSCIPYVSNFPLDTEWIFAVDGPIEVRGLGDENFSFPWCASAWLRAKDADLASLRSRLRD